MFFYNFADENMTRHLSRIVGRFRKIRNTEKRKLHKRPKTADEIVQNLQAQMKQSPKKSLKKIIHAVPRTPCQKVLKRN